MQYVLMTASPDCLEDRCVRRGYRPGFGRWSLTANARLPHDYELTFDSERMTTQECAATILADWS